MASDFRLALRTLSKNPAFTAISIAALALGIGANTAIFSGVNGVLLNPTGVRDPDRIVAFRVHYFKIGLKDIGVSAPDYADIARTTDVFESAGLAGNMDFGLTFTGGAMPERLRNASVNPRWFDIFKATPLKGRTFTEEENQPANRNYVVLSYGIWQRLFAGDPDIVGKKASFNEQPYQILGVMPQGFHMPFQTEIWTPIALSAVQYTAQSRFNESYWGVARLKPGVTFDQAQARVSQVTANVIAQEQKGRNSDEWGMFLKPFTDEIAGPLKLALTVLMFAAAFVLLIACANVAGLQLARASSRTKEIAIRQALGAGRAQLVRQLLVESLLLSVAGGLAGLGLGYLGVNFLTQVVPASEMSMLPTVKLDWMALAFTAAVTLIVGVLFGIAPALQGSSAKHHETLKEGGRSGTSGSAKQRFRATLVGAELALALVLLAGTGLFLRSLARVRDVNPGFNPRGILSAMTVLPETKYKEDNKKIAFVNSTLEKLSQAPGVSEAAAAVPLPFSGDDWSASFRVEGRQRAPNEPGPHGGQRYITPNYFHLMGIPLVKGRYFTDADRAGALKVAIIDSKLADVYFKDEDPIGRRIDHGNGWETIVGVVAYNRHNELETESKGSYFVPFAQNPPPLIAFLVKTSGNAANLMNTMRQAVLDVDHSQPVYSVKTMDERIEESLGTRRTVVTLLVLFGGLALVLAGLGLYGVISYAVSQRTQEFGIRMALGAAQSQVLGQVLRQGGLVVLAGVAAGLVAALSCGRLIASQLYQVEAYDWIAFLSATAILAAVAFAAAIIPARRATKVDPMIALRYE